MRTGDLAVPLGPVHELPDDTLICECRQVTKGAIATAIRSGHASLASLGCESAAGTGCTSCHQLLNQLITAYRPRGPGHPGPKTAKLAEISPAAVRPVLKRLAKPLNPVEQAKQDRDG